MAGASQVDFLVMGAGVAGLRAAVELARHGEVLLVTKESVAESNTHYALKILSTRAMGWFIVPRRRCLWPKGPCA
jgi:aspartate oxidase